MGRKRTTPTKGSGEVPSEEKEIDKQLREKGLWRKPVAKDGSCLFRAVSEQVYHSQVRHRDVRQTCIGYMRRNAEQFEPFVEGPFDHYLARLYDPREWGGHVEMTALAQIFMRDFIVYKIDELPQNVTSKGYDDKINLFFSGGNHYDCVYSLSFQRDAALCQSLVYNLLFNSVFKQVKDGEPEREWKSPEATTMYSKLLDPVQYVNVELEVWKGERQALQKSDMNVATVMQLQAGDFCEAQVGGASSPFRTVSIMESRLEKHAFLVRDVQTQKEHLVNCQLIRTRGFEFQSLTGYYMKPSQQGSPGNRRRSRGGRRSGSKEAQSIPFRRGDNESASEKQRARLSAPPPPPPPTTPQKETEGVPTHSLTFPPLGSHASQSSSSLSKSYAQIAAIPERSSKQNVVPSPAPSSQSSTTTTPIEETPVVTNTKEDGDDTDNAAAVAKENDVTNAEASSFTKDASPPFTFGDFSPVKKKDSSPVAVSAPSPSSPPPSPPPPAAEDPSLDDALVAPTPPAMYPRALPQPQWFPFPPPRSPYSNTDFLAMPFSSAPDDLPEDRFLLHFTHNVGVQYLKAYASAVQIAYQHQLNLWHMQQQQRLAFTTDSLSSERSHSSERGSNEIEEETATATAAAITVEELNEQARIKAAEAFQASEIAKLKEKNAQSASPPTVTSTSVPSSSSDPAPAPLAPSTSSDHHHNRQSQITPQLHGSRVYSSSHHVAGPPASASISFPLKLAAVSDSRAPSYQPPKSNLQSNPPHQHRAFRPSVRKSTHPSPAPPPPTDTPSSPSAKEVYYSPQHGEFVKKTGNQLKTVGPLKKSHYVPPGANWYQPNNDV